MPRYWIPRFLCSVVGFLRFGNIPWNENIFDQLWFMHLNSGLLIQGVNSESLLNGSGDGGHNGNGHGNNVRRQSGSAATGYHSKLLPSGKTIKLLPYGSEWKKYDKDTDNETLPGSLKLFNWSNPDDKLSNQSRFASKNTIFTSFLVNSTSLSWKTVNCFSSSCFSAEKNQIKLCRSRFNRLNVL